MTKSLRIIAASGLLFAACSTANTALSWPLPDAPDRPTPLHFGRYVTPDPEQNPIDPPERFTGYHTATDFEISAAEEDEEIPVSAICSGEVIHAGQVEGYGGVIVHRCVIDDQNVTVLYGHLNLNQNIAVGDTVEQNQQLATLADEYSPESGFTRKHLHLGIHRGTALEFRGYVQTEGELDAYIDPLSVLPEPAFPFLDIVDDLEKLTESGADTFPHAKEESTPSSETED